VPSTLVHVAVGGLVGAALLGDRFTPRAIAVVLVAAAVPDVDSFLTFVGGAHRSALHTFLLPAVLAVGLYWDCYVAERSRLAARFGPDAGYVAAVALASLVAGGILPDLFTNGVNALWPLHDQFYTVGGELLLSDQRGLVQTFVDLSPEEAAELMQAGLDIAAEYVAGCGRESPPSDGADGGRQSPPSDGADGGRQSPPSDGADGPALALKTGRPHYEVSDAVWDASNAVLKHGLALGAEHDCAVQLHTEASDDLTEIAEWAKARGLSREGVVKHYAGGRLAGPTPSVRSEKDRLKPAVEVGEPFLMETDYVDDPNRPGAVLGPKTVPRRVRWLLQEGHDEAVRNAHVETPKLVYDVDTEATLARE